ncbi:unnamed protein product [Adineta ricciae]|uniref:ADP ribosyltransferase domain-containing protein n=2 Tax=Adineta ricciae TaxID=249248 RepID=A0A813R0R6_ADIRI|nr:unnamed protein product [Adineta ricciae]
MASKLVTQSTRQRFSRQENDDESITISIFQKSETSSTDLNGDFLWFQLFIEVLLRMKDFDDSKQELVNVAYQQYDKDGHEKQKIDEFSISYVALNAVKWYTRNSFVYRMLNKALRQKDMDTLYAFRRIIIDIHDQLEDMYARRVNKKSVIHLYRGQSISREEVEWIKANVGNFLSMNSFLSTSINRDAALMFAEAQEGFQGVLFDLQIDETLVGAKPFANITSLSYYPDEEETLFMLGTIFRIAQVTFDIHTNVWVVSLDLCSDNDSELKPSLDSLKEQIDDETNLYELGRILWKMSQLDASERCFKRLIAQNHPNPVIIPGCYLHLGNIAGNKGNYEQAIAYHRCGLELRQKTLPSNHPHLPYSHNALGEALRKHGDFDEALQQYKNAFILWQQEYNGDDHPNIAMCLHNIGTIHAQRNELQQAVNYFTRALQIMARCLPTIHPMVASSLRNIGSILGLIGQLDQAREAFQKVISIQRQCLPSTHPDLAGSLRDMGTYHFNTGNLSQALNYYQEASTILHQTLSVDHPLCVEIREDIAEVEACQASLLV